MKTILPDTINNQDEAKKFLSDLHMNNEAYHPEDDAHDIIFVTSSVSKVERTQLNKLMNDIYTNVPRFDPCGYLIDLDIK
jgi:hypothetical protein